MYYLNATPLTEKPTINLADFGFARGITVFELFRVYGGKPFRMEEHLNRLEDGAARLGIPLPLTRTQIRENVAALIAAHGYAHSAVKMYLTAGIPDTTSGLSLGATSGLHPQLVMLEDEVKPNHPHAPYGLEKYKTGQALQTVNCIRELPAIKTANYGIAYYAAKQAGPQVDDILFTTPEGYVTEASRANFFCVINHELCTPAQGMLKGITRALVLELAKEQGIKTSERNLTPAEIETATEAFTSGSIAELVPARSINGKPMQSTMEGPVFSKLRQAFSECVARECGTPAANGSQSAA